MPNVTLTKCALNAALLSLGARVSTSPEEQAAKTEGLQRIANTTQAYLKSPMKACTSLLSGNGFPIAALQADGFAKGKIGPLYFKQLKSGTLGNPNGVRVGVAQSRQHGCTISMTGTGGLNTNLSALISELVAQGWTFDRAASKRKRVYRRGTATLSLDGGAYSSVRNFSLTPASPLLVSRP